MGESVSRLLGREIIFKESRDRLDDDDREIVRKWDLHGINKEPPFTNVSLYLRPRFEIDFPFDEGVNYDAISILDAEDT